MHEQQKSFSFLNSFVKGETHLGVWSFIKKGIGFMDSFFILRALSLYQIGVYQLLLSLYGTLSDIFLDLFSQVSINEITRFVGRGKESHAKKLFLEYAAFRILFAIIPIVITLISAEYFADRYGSEALLWIKVLSLLFLVDTLTTLFTALLNLRLEFQVISIRPTLQKVVQFSILAYFFFFSHLTILTVFIAQVAAPIVLLVLLLPPVIRSYRLWGTVTASSDALFWPLVSTYGKWDIPKIIFSGLTGRVRPFLIKIFLSTEAVGIFSIAYTAVSLLKDLLPTRTLTALVPRKAHDQASLDRIYTHGTKYYTLVAFLLSIAGAIGYPIAIMIFFRKFSSSIPIFYLLLPILIIFAFTKLISILLLVKRRQKFFFFQSVIENFFGITLMLIFLPLGGLWGLAIATTCADLIVDVIRYLYLVRTGFLYSFPWRQLLVWDSRDRQLVASFRSLLFKRFRKKLS